MCRYEVILADTAESKKIHFQLRYLVYCCDKGYLKESEPGTQMEQDIYDDQSVHFLIKHENEWIGTFRLVIDRLSSLPFHSVSVLEPGQFDSVARVAELSRLGIVRKFQNLPNSPNLSPGHESEMMMSLMRAVRQYCHENKILEVVFFCRRSIARILGRFNMPVRQIGPGNEYFGLRVPFAINMDTPSVGFLQIDNADVGGQKAYRPYSLMI